MRTIWKFPLETTDEFYLMMPAGAEILHVATQRDAPCIWAVVETENPPVKRFFTLIGTGYPVPEPPLPYIWNISNPERAFRLACV
jgi:hypothetical protein